MPPSTSTFARVTSVGMIPPAVFDVLRSYLEARADFGDEDFGRVREAFLYKRARRRGFPAARRRSHPLRGIRRDRLPAELHHRRQRQRAHRAVRPGNVVARRLDQPRQRHAVPVFHRCHRGFTAAADRRPIAQRLVEGVPSYAAAFRTGLQRHTAAKDQRIVTALSASAEERYLEFLRVYPSIALRVPQMMLASYLGMTPETLSRIRKNLSRRRG